MMLNLTKNQRWIRMLCITVLSVLVWLFLDVLNVRFNVALLQYQWFDGLLWFLQYVIFIYGFKDFFSSRSYFKAWLIRGFVALLVCAAFIICMLPLFLSFHVWVGGRL